MLIAMRNAVMSLLAVIVFSSFIQAQTITGKVLDKTGAGLPGVSVTVKGTGRGTSTNTEGSFSIDNIKQGAVLQFSAAGFTPQDFTVAGTEPITIILETAITGLNEVVVIGYGGTTRKKDVTGAIASVKAKDFNQGVIASPDQLLQSKVPGLEIVTNSGQPGAATTIKIRGNNSLRSGNSPLYVVDGVPLDGRTAKPGLNFGGGSGLDFGTTPESNPFLYINPYDIAQMDVLKDASAAAIYGSRGANGVVVITTNRGRSGEMRLDFSTRMGVTAGYMHKYKVFDAGGFRSALDKYGLNNSLDHGSDVDALKEVTQSALSQEYNLSLSGGNDNGKFRASFLGSRNNGFLKKTSLDKYLGNFSGEYKFLDKRLTIGFGLIAGHTTEHMGLISNTAGAGGNLISYALNWNPTAPLRNSNGLYTSATNSVPNPMAVIDGYNDVANVNVFLGNITSKVNIVKGLDYTFLYSINHGKGKRNTSIDGWVDGINGVSGIGVAALSDAALTSQIFQHMLNYNGNITENLKLEALVGYEYFKSNYTNSSVFGSQFNTNLDQATRIPILYTSFFQNAKTQTPLVTYVDPTTEIQSYFSRLKFGLLEKYFVDISVRADGSSKFGANNKYGYFPAIGAKWTISNEEFLKNSTTVSFLGLRASWGITGNQEFPSGASLEQFSSGSYNGIGQSNVANPDLKWGKNHAGKCGS